MGSELILVTFVPISVSGAIPNPVLVRRNGFADWPYHASRCALRFILSIERNVSLNRLLC